MKNPLLPSTSPGPSAPKAFSGLQGLGKPVPAVNPIPKPPKASAAPRIRNRAPKAYSPPKKAAGGMGSIAGIPGIPMPKAPKVQPKPSMQPLPGMAALGSPVGSFGPKKSKGMVKF